MANGNKTIWAWAVPAYFGGSPVDHTWVTDYDNRLSSYPTINSVVQAGNMYWFCWGSFHSKGGTSAITDGFLGSISANAHLATCLVMPNQPSNGNPPAQGTIFQYGIDGVCHQLANQVLFSSQATSGGPLTVNRARGYHVSTFLFGTYGRQLVAWRNQVAKCTSGMVPSALFEITTQSMDATAGDDEFAQRARAVLSRPDAAKRLQQLLSVRGNALRTAESMRARADNPGLIRPSAAELNAHYNEVLRQAAEILTPVEYLELFGFEPGEVVNLVDPDMVQPSPRR